MLARASSQSKPSFAACYTVVAFIIFLRRPITFLRSEFWAEDASEFFAPTFHAGISLLWTVSTGYHHFLARLIAHFTSFLPVLWAPYVYAWTSAAFACFVVSYFIRDSFSWIISERWMRFVFILALSIVPGSQEVFSNLCNLHSVSTLFALLLILEHQNATLHWKRACLLILCFLSGAESILLFPILLYRSLVQKSFGWTALCAMGIGIAGLNLFASANYGGSIAVQKVSLSELVSICFTQFVSHTLLAPLLGPKITGALVQWEVVWVWIFGCICLLSLFYLSRHSLASNQPIAWIVLSALCLCGTFGIIALARSYNLSQLQPESGRVFWTMRYAFLPAIGGLLFWFTLTNKAPSLVKASVILLLFLHQVVHWKNVPSRPDLKWPEKASEIKAALALKKLGKLNAQAEIRNIRIQPDNYTHFDIVIYP